MDKEKSVDESWKESAAQEKENLANLNTGSDEQSQIHVNEPIKEPEEEVSTEASHTEAETATDAGSDETQTPEINFLSYISSLGFQAMIFLGEIPNPVTNETERNLQQAKFIIDTLGLLREKTKGNLNKQEEDLLNGSVYELQVKFVEISQKESGESEEGQS